MYYNISQKEYSKYFVFSVVRCPWDRLVSGYEFIKQSGAKYVRPVNREVFSFPAFEMFEGFVTDLLSEADLFSLGEVFFSQYHSVCDENKKIIVDFVGRYVDLEGAVRAISEASGKAIELPRVNISKSRREYQTFYSEDTKKLSLAYTQMILLYLVTALIIERIFRTD